ncbi:4a-hydroxytetrahydrobiopterin dehydratase [Micromonospora sp. NPDC005203]|uniref:4a-hydroxytetrahydrobiopterin dehydratase n=1 Tax=Micromonospora sp. NPDC005203 TaxID=3364226 RepID=UPI0036D0E8A2
MADLLSVDAVREELSGLTDWSSDPTGIGRTVQLGSFPDVIAVVDRVAAVAEEVGHHPDIDIRWRTLTGRARSWPFTDMAATPSSRSLCSATGNLMGGWLRCGT